MLLIRRLLISALLLLPSGLSLFAAPPRSLSNDQYAQTLQTLFFYIKNNYVDEVSSEKLYEGAIDGMLKSLHDPYSLLLTGETLSSISDLANGKYAGIGIYITWSDDTPYPQIISAIPTSAASKGGLERGDIIIEINGKSQKDLSPTMVSQSLRGKPGSTIELTIGRKKDQKSFEKIKLTLKREIMKIPSTEGLLLPHKVGYIRIFEFTSDTGAQFKSALSKLIKAGAVSLIIDLQDNGGGVFQGAVDIANLLLSKGVIVSTRGRIKAENEVYKAEKPTLVPKSFKVAALINSGTASASEILAGALQGNKRAKIFGQRSYGKGSIQAFIPFGDAAIKITVARYYTPKGVSISHIGIKPNVAIHQQILSAPKTAKQSTLRKNGDIMHFIGDHKELSLTDLSVFAEKTAKKYNLPLRVVQQEIIPRLPQGMQPLYALTFPSSISSAMQYLKSEKR